MKYNLCCNCPFKVRLSLSNSGGESLLLDFGCVFFFFFFFFKCIQPHVFRWGFHFLCYLESGQEIHCLNYESQASPLLVASTSWLLTINRAVKMNPQDCTSGRPRMDTHTGEPCIPHLFQSLRLSGKPLPHKQSPEGLCVYCLQIISKLSYGS